MEREAQVGVELALHQRFNAVEVGAGHASLRQQVGQAICVNDDVAAIRWNIVLVH